MPFLSLFELHNVLSFVAVELPSSTHRQPLSVLVMVIIGMLDALVFRTSLNHGGMRLSFIPHVSRR